LQMLMGIHYILYVRGNDALLWTSPPMNLIKNP
jgi:hypothetical protein